MAIKVLSTNITSPLGMTTEENYQAVKSGCSALTRYEGKWGLPEPFCASLFTDAQNEAMKMDGYTRFESVIIHSVNDALAGTSFDTTSSRVVLIVSTTKGNIELLDNPECDEEREYPASAAQKIADTIGVTTMPIVVCNACISGAAAQVLALRLLDADLYDYAIITGADCQSPFVVSGFQSFKAVSDEPCRPFDIERLGLNLGEAAATIIFGKDSSTDWALYRGSVRNDAFHISSPSPKGDGAYAVLNSILADVDRNELAMISVHGTATMYNDQMESKAIQRAELSNVPVSALKGYFGHTMGAAGLLETIISMRSINDGFIPANRGFEELGVSGKMDITPESRPTNKTAFVKMISGFGGCNASLLLGKSLKLPSTDYHRDIKHQDTIIKISPERVEIDGKVFQTENTGKAMLTEIYKSQVGDYPKFYKMDSLARLAFVASELLIKTVKDIDAEHTSLVLFNRTSSIVSDRQHHSEMMNLPSPSVFVYTLPNIMTGEIAIRNGLKGETSLYIIDRKEWPLMESIAVTCFYEQDIHHIIYGWVDYKDDMNFEAEIKYI